MNHDQRHAARHVPCVAERQSAAATNTPHAGRRWRWLTLRPQRLDHVVRMLMQVCGRVRLHVSPSLRIKRMDECGKDVNGGASLSPIDRRLRRVNHGQQGVGQVPVVDVPLARHTFHTGV